MATLLLLLSLNNSAQADEIEFLIYDDNTSTTLLHSQLMNPWNELPSSHLSLSGEASANVYEASAPAGKKRVCIDFRNNASGPWHTFCVVANSTGSEVKGVHWVEDIALGLLVNTESSPETGYKLSEGNLPNAASSSCSVACDDGSTCAAECTTGCTAGCTPSASCGCAS